MVQFNTRANEILIKLVYYGPGLSGKTTNLQSLHKLCGEAQRGEMFSVNTQEDRTLFFDLLPINLGYIYGNAIHLQVYTVPGQVQYDASRRVVLGGADGVVFVADSSESKMQDNVDSLSNLYHNLNANRLNIKQIPFVLQYNKRDLPDAMPVGVMNRRLNFRNVPFFEARANHGFGVRETFLAITRETVDYTFKKYHLDKKVRDFRELMALVETNLQESFREPEDPAEAPQDATILRHSGVTIETLPISGLVDPGELLEDALKSNMETARLFSDLKGVKEDLERKHSELVEVNKQLERAHQDGLKTRRFLEQLVQNIGDAVVSFSLDGKVLTWNAAAERIFGYSRPEIIGKAFGTLVPPADHTELTKIIQRVAQGQTLRGLRGTCLRKAGIPFASAMTYAPVKSADDRVIAISALLRDLEEHPALGPAPPVPPMLEASAKRLEPAIAEAYAILESAMDPDQAGRSAKLVRLLEEVQSMLRGAAPTAPVPLPEPPKPAPPAPPRGGRVLLVDDESAILDCMAEALEAWGHAATSCSRGEEAVQALKSHDYDLVISDIRMPGLSGIDLFNWIQVNRPQLKGHVLFTTGDAFDGTTLDFLDQHGLKHLPKPFDLRQLQRSVTEMLPH